MTLFQVLHRFKKIPPHEAGLTVRVCACTHYVHQLKMKEFIRSLKDQTLEEKFVENAVMTMQTTDFKPSL